MENHSREPHGESAPCGVTKWLSEDYENQPLTASINSLFFSKLY